MFGKLKKRGQVSIFVIIAIVVVGGIIAYFLLRTNIGIGGIPTRFQPVENNFLNCIEDSSSAGIALLEQGGGVIYFEDFVPGNNYNPSSNYLDFFGMPIHYWYYISGNNLEKENVPTKTSMEEQLKKYIEENLNCDFSEFSKQGFDINLGQITADVQISNNKVDVSVSGRLDIKYETESYSVLSHDKEIQTRLGEFYNTALSLYNYENQENFLEKYALDVLYSYAPVNGVELSCSPKTWSFGKIKDSIMQGIQNNFIMLKTKNSYYKSSRDNSYFVVDLDTNAAVQFLYSENWPTKIESQDENGILIANPVGTQEGLGILGFCYVPYHFIYDITFPVLMQVYDEKETFQFPVSVVIKGNKERQALPATALESDTIGLCNYKNSQVDVFTYNTNLDPVEADISFKCFNEQCDIGKTQSNGNSAYLSGSFPQCVNGFIIAKASGYKTQKQMISTNEESNADIILEKIYNVSVNFYLDNKENNDFALIYFNSGEESSVVVWPEQREVNLAEGLYNVSVFVYRNSSIVLPASTTPKCIQVPKPGLMGMLGQTTENCFDLTIPSQTISNVIIGGGASEIYITETELEKGKMKVYTTSVGVPKTIEDLQKNYNLVNSNSIYLDFIEK